ncbi:MAG: AmmeMemoRadiSam system protein B, partial [Desulfatitalea sp.]
MMTAARLFFILFFLGWGSAALAGTVRPAAWAGKFYPQAPDELKRTIAGLMDQASRTRVDSLPQGRMRALILPHAGYIYSGLTAAHAHRVLAGTVFTKVILMGPDHRVGFADAAVSDVAAYATPLGTVPLHADAGRLRAEAALFRPVPESDRSEHCLEVVLPFLQTDLPAMALVPIVVGRCEPEAIGRAIVPLIDGQTL